MKSILLFACLLITCTYLKAQTIQGKIVDHKSNEGIPFANIKLMNELDTSLLSYIATDSLGRFELKAAGNGSYVLSIALLGYHPLNRKVTITNSNSIDLGNIAIAEDATTLQTVNVTGGAANFTTKDGQIKIGVAGNSFFKSSANLLDVFRKLPGLQISPDGTMLLASRATPTLFVDGKPVNMNADEIQAYLSGLSPEMVESIEVISQPSSRYDGQYQGIIDVKLKRNLSLGLNGIYNLRFQQNHNSMLDHNLLLTYKSRRLVYNMSLGHIYGDNYYRYHALQYLADANAMTTDTRTITANANYNVQTRVAFEPTKGHSVEAFLRTYQIRRNGQTNNQLVTRTPDLHNTLAIILSDNDSHPRQYNYAGGINYDAQFKTGELHVVTALAQVDNRQVEDIQNLNQMTSTLVNYWKTNSRNNILIRSGQADYIQQLKHGKLELGGKYAFTSTANNLRYDTLGTTGFSLDPNRSNQFGYREYISAAFVSYLASLNKLSFNIGLRAEHTRSVATSITEGTVTEREGLKWLPSLRLTYTISQGQELTFSYSRRLTRPTFDALNPFRFYFSPRNYWIGNPYLQPSTTELFSLSYSRKAFQISIHAGREKDPMVRYPSYDPTTNILAFLGTNLPYRDFANIQANAPISVNKWWRMNHNVGFFYNKELRPYFGQTFHLPIYNYTINGSQVFTLNKWQVDLSYNYESKSGSGIYIYAPVYTLDIGLQRSWMNNKLNSKLTVQDLFDNGQRRIIFREKSIINNDFYHDTGVNKLVLSLSYSFGSSTYKAKEVRKSEEERRVN